MMISPEMFVELHKDKKYKELFPVRDELIADILEFENKTYDPRAIGRISDLMWCYNPFRQITLNKDVGINGAV